MVMTLEDAPTAPTNVIATEVNSTHVITTDGDVTELNITGLIPFTNYTLYVEGVTVDIGDKSADVIVMTLEDYIITYNLSESDDITLTGSARTVTIGDLLPFTFAPTAPTNVIATEVNSTHVTVEWDEPDTPNGIVRQYIIITVISLQPVRIR
jgi:hypothetical protein